MWVKMKPKMKILSSFAHPQVVANLYEFLSSDEHKGRYFDERLEPKSCLAPLTSIVEKKKYYQVLQNISLCVQQKKETHTGLKQLEGE